jgi:hypothetical protein
VRLSARGRRQLRFLAKLENCSPAAMVETLIQREINRTFRRLVEKKIVFLDTIDSGMEAGNGRA